MKIALVGDSIFDNASYVNEKAVIDHLDDLGLENDLLAVDGAVVRDAIEQLDSVGKDIKVIVISVGGNDALQSQTYLGMDVSSVTDALLLLGEVVDGFRSDYAELLNRAMRLDCKTAVCTIYDKVPNLPKPQEVALMLFNDVIVDEATKRGLMIIDLRHVCTEPEDYSPISPIEPSDIGGEKIAESIDKYICSLGLHPFDLQNFRLPPEKEKLYLEFRNRPEEVARRAEHNLARVKAIAEGKVPNISLPKNEGQS